MKYILDTIELAKVLNSLPRDAWQEYLQHRVVTLLEQSGAMDTAEECPRCHVKMERGTALAYTGSSCFSGTDPAFIACLKCPACGHSESMNTRLPDWLQEMPVEIPRGTEYSEEFEKFWIQYPPVRWSPDCDDKPTAWQVWRTLVGLSFKAAIKSGVDKPYPLLTKECAKKLLAQSLEKLAERKESEDWNHADRIPLASTFLKYFGVRFEQK